MAETSTSPTSATSSSSSSTVAKRPASKRAKPQLNQSNVKPKSDPKDPKDQFKVCLDKQGNLKVLDCVVNAHGLGLANNSRLTMDLVREDSLPCNQSDSSREGTPHHSNSNSRMGYRPRRSSEDLRGASSVLTEFPDIQRAGQTAEGKPVITYQLSALEDKSPENSPRTQDAKSKQRSSHVTAEGYVPRWEDFETVSRRVLGDGATSTVHIVNYIGPRCDGADSGKRKKKLYADKVIKLSRPEIAPSVYRELCVIRDGSMNNNRHVVQSFQAFFVEDEIHIIMEFMNLGSLTDVLRKLPKHILRGPPLYSVLYQVLLGLKSLHQPEDPRKHGPILHRDIKPSNIMLSKRGWVKLADFGCVKVTAQEAAADTATFIGTKNYMSPERLERLGVYATSADIWSIGVVAYECALGRHPFKPSDEASWVSMLEVMQKGPDFSTDTTTSAKADPATTCDPLLRDFISACLRYDPASRPSATELLDHPLFAEVKSDPQGILNKWRKTLADSSSASTTSSTIHTHHHHHHQISSSSTSTAPSAKIVSTENGKR